MHKTLRVGLLLICVGINAQMSNFYTQKSFDYQLAQTHYLSEAYPGAQYDFQKILYFDESLGDKQKLWAELYSINTALLFADANAIEAFEQFREKHPESPVQKQMYYAAGQYYLHQNDTEKALHFLQKADTQGFSFEKRSYYHFTLGYIYFTEENYTKAAKELQNLADKEPYLAPKNYIMGHIAYTEKNYSEARSRFEKIANIPEYQDLIEPYKVQMSFNEGDYQEASYQAKSLLENQKYPHIEVELSKIIGESEFRLGNYKEATPYLKSYIDQKKEPFLPDYYQLGYVYYVQGNYTEAISYFNKITQEQSPLAQNAFYQLGNSYLKNNQKKEALSAFKSASEMDYNSTITENALYQYALISYDIGNPYQAAAEAIQLYMKSYPNSAHKAQMEQLLVSSFMLSKNYKGALESLAQISNKSAALMEAEQNLALMQGISLFHTAKYSESILYFNRAMNANTSSPNYAKAAYWKGIAQYQMSNYEQALVSFKKIENLPQSFPEKQQLPYDIAYCYLKLDQYEEAKKYFQQYLKNPKNEYKADAQLRLADSYYGNDDIDLAIATYDTIEESGSSEQDFAAFQKAKLLGFKNDFPEQIEALNAFLKNYPSSSYREEAYYELGLAYQKTESYLQSIAAFDKVLQTKNSTEFTALSMIGKANDYAALKEYPRALNTYKDVAQTFKNTEYAQQAVLASKNIFIEQGNMSAYQKFAQENGINLSQSETEELQFLEVQKWYNEKNYKKAIPSLEEFVRTYPQSSRIQMAQFYLGDAYYGDNQDEKAIQYLEPLAQKQNDFQEDALYDLGRIYIDKQKDEQAQYAYEALYKITQNKNYKNTCEVELMYLYDESGNTTQAKSMAEKVLANPKNSISVIEQAKLILARSYLNGQMEKAKKEFAALENAQNPEVQAEAYYYNAFFKNKEKQYEASNQVIFDLTSNLSDQQYWGAKALILMADNYIYLKDTYQASYILEELIANYQDFPDVVQEAKKLQSKIKK